MNIKLVHLETCEDCMVLHQRQFNQQIPVSNELSVAFARAFACETLWGLYGPANPFTAHIPSLFHVRKGAQDLGLCSCTQRLNVLVCHDFEYICLRVISAI